ncbi:TetR/AcrR family transcriptional regulator [soil metagenome]
MARTQQQRRIETRALLLDAAADLFARQGFHATPAEAVADAADRTTGALYDHFGGKDGLLVALLERWIEQAVIELAASTSRHGDLDDRLGALWGGVSRRHGEAGGAWLLLELELWLHAVRNPELGVVGAARFAAMRHGLAGGLTDWSTELDFALPGPADELATQVIALLVGLAVQHRVDPVVAPRSLVVAGLRRLLDLPAATEPSTAESIESAMSRPTDPSIDRITS